MHTAERDDAKIHALNIMKFIFSDTYLRQDVNSFIPRAMILSMEEFSSDNWSIRNSALMCFTALIKRLFDNFHIQNQDLSKKRGMSIVCLISSFPDLFQYFKTKLSQLVTATKDLDKQKQDLVVFSILLLTSRLVPYAFATPEETEQ